MWSVSAYINSNLFHYLDGTRIDVFRRFGTCGKYINFMTE